MNINYKNIVNKIKKYKENLQLNILFNFSKKKNILKGKENNLNINYKNIVNKRKLQLNILFNFSKKKID